MKQNQDIKKQLDSETILTKPNIHQRKTAIYTNQKKGKHKY